MSCWKFCFVLLYATPLVSPVIIRCYLCQQHGPEEICDYSAINGTCFELIASKQFATIRKANPSLEIPEQNTGYQCFELKTTDSDPFVKGCTYENLDLCAELPKAVHCYTCKTSFCNSLKAKSNAVVSGGLLGLIAFLVWLSVLNIFF